MERSFGGRKGPKRLISINYPLYIASNNLQPGTSSSPLLFTCREFRGDRGVKVRLTKNDLYLSAVEKSGKQNRFPRQTPFNLHQETFYEERVWLTTPLFILRTFSTYSTGQRSILDHHVFSLSLFPRRVFRDCVRIFLSFPPNLFPFETIHRSRYYNLTLMPLSGARTRLHRDIIWSNLKIFSFSTHTKQRFRSPLTRRPEECSCKPMNVNTRPLNRDPTRYTTTRTELGRQGRKRIEQKFPMETRVRSTLTLCTRRHLDSIPLEYFPSWTDPQSLWQESRKNCYVKKILIKYNSFAFARESFWDPRNRKICLELFVGGWAKG